MSDALARLRGRETAAAALLLVALLGLTFPDVVFRGRTLLTSPYTFGVLGNSPPHGYPGRPAPFNLYVVDPGASSWQWEPLTAKASRLYRAGRLPLWNASQGFGAPLAANMHSSVFFPPELPLLLWPRPRVWDAYLLARLLFAGLATFLLLRRLGLGGPAAFAGGTAFMLSGYFQFWINASWLNVDMLAPALLYAVERVATGGGGRWLWALAALVAGSVLGGMPESTFVVLLLTGAFAAFRLAGRLASAGWRAALRRAALLLAAALLGTGLSAFLLWPFAEYVLHAHHLHTTEGAFGLRYFPLRGLVNLILPYAGGPPLGSNPVPLHYAGLGVVALAVTGLLAGRGGDRWFFAAVAALSLAKKYGVGNRIGTWPLFELVDFPKHLGVVICLCLAALAGYGIDAVARERRPRAALLGPVLALALAAGFLVIRAAELGETLTPARVVAALGAATALAVALQGLLVLAAIRPRWASAAAAGCVALVAAELLYLAPRPERPRRHRADTPPPALAAIEKGGGRRVFGLDGVLYPDTSSYFDLPDIRALDALFPARYVGYLRALVNPSVHDRFTGGLSSSLVRETYTRCGANPWFDLLGVEYVVTSRRNALDECAGRPGLAADILRRPGRSQTLREAEFVIDGVRKPVLFAHPPGDVRFSLRPGERHRALAFSLALDPRVWAPDKGDGVQFEVLVVAGGRQVPAFSRWVDPKARPEDRRWIDGTVDLAPWRGQDIEVALVTRGGASADWDWAGWGDLRLEGARPAPEPARQYALVYDGELRVYRNHHAWPRAFVVHAAESVTDSAAALRRIGQLDFDPATRVVVEGLPAGALPAPDAAAADGPVPAEVLVYEDARVVVRTRSARPGMLVLTDVFYPGWSASVDGAPAPLYAADYAFRGVPVAAGEHTVEFRYRPRSFTGGAMVSAASLLALAGLGWRTGKGGA